MESASACYICQQRTHRSDMCAELLKELKPGFYKPSGGMPQGGGDDDESAKMSRIRVSYKLGWVDTPSLTPTLNTNSGLGFSLQVIF